jgi:hypothetical protein
MLVRPFVSRVCLFFVVSLPACDCHSQRKGESESEIAMFDRMQIYNTVFGIGK